MKTILVPITDDVGLEASLQAGFDLARAFGGHLVCQQVTPYAAYALGDPGLGAFPIAELVAAVDAARDALRARVEARLKTEAVSWEYRLDDGDLVDCIVAAARLADIVVMSRGGPDRVGDVAVQAPAPVLAVAPHTRGVAVAGRALVAWDGSQEAAVALRAALPMLRLAATVTLLTVAEKASAFVGIDAATFLSRHGVAADVVTRPPLAEGVAATIVAELERQGAAWLVSGAYGHARVREMLFGGVTRTLIAAPPVPLLLAH